MVIKGQLAKRSQIEEKFMRKGPFIPVDCFKTRLLFDVIRVFLIYFYHFLLI